MTIKNKFIIESTLLQIVIIIIYEIYVISSSLKNIYIHSFIISLNFL